MKKVIAIALVALSLVGCGERENTANWKVFKTYGGSVCAVVVGGYSEDKGRFLKIGLADFYGYPSAYGEIIKINPDTGKAYGYVDYVKGKRASKALDIITSDDYLVLGDEFTFSTAGFSEEFSKAKAQYERDCK